MKVKKSRRKALLKQKKANAALVDEVCAAVEHLEVAIKNADKDAMDTAAKIMGWPSRKRLKDE